MTANPYVGLVPVSSAADPDAELIRVCHQFAEADLASWYRYLTAPEDVADEQDEPLDFDTLHWIAATPATTPDGIHAKALAYAAWERDAYEGNGMDSAAPLLASLLRDMIAPARRAILTRLQAELGPLPDGYDSEWRFIGYNSKPPPDPAGVAPPEGGADMIDAGQHAAAERIASDLGILADIMEHIGDLAPDNGRLPGLWLVWFGRRVGDASEALERALSKTQ